MEVLEEDLGELELIRAAGLDVLAGCPSGDVSLATE